MKTASGIEVTTEMVIDAIVAFNHWDDRDDPLRSDLRAEVARQVRHGDMKAVDMKRALMAALNRVSA